jgi:hypothetical protein
MPSHGGYHVSPSAIESHASRTADRASQVGSHARALGGTSLAGHSLGPLASNTAGTVNSHLQRAGDAVSVFSGRMHGVASQERTTAANYRDNDQATAAAFNKVRRNSPPSIRTSMASAAPARPPSIAGSAGPRSSHNVVTGEDALGTEHQFSVNDVQSIPLNDPHGKPLGVFFPTKTGPARPGYVSDTQITDGVNQGTYWSAHNQYQPLVATGNPRRPIAPSGPPKPTPWANQGTPIHAWAHGSPAGFGVTVNTPHGPRVMTLDAQNYAHVLSANQHFQAAVNHNPNGPLLLGSCSVSANSNVGGDTAAALHNTHGFPNTVYSSNSVVQLKYNRRTGDVGMNMMPGNSMVYGPYEGGFVAHQPPSHQPPSPEPGTPMTPYTPSSASSSAPSSPGVPPSPHAASPAAPPSPYVPQSQWFDTPPQAQQPLPQYGQQRSQWFDTPPSSP